jgi:SUMO ligase MMS21 Smc5/6 complex component
VWNKIDIATTAFHRLCFLVVSGRKEENIKNAKKVRIIEIAEPVWRDRQLTIEDLRVSVVLVNAKAKITDLH